MFSYPWVVQKPIESKRALELLQKSVKSKQFTNGGPVKHELESFLHGLLRLDKDHRVQMAASGTAALHALVGAYNILHKKRLRWVTQAFTFPSSLLGPCKGSLIVDNDPDYLGPSLSALEEKKNEFDGVIVTNVFGTLVNVAVYEEWCKANRKILLFDNAATPLSFIEGSNTCNRGDGAIISFHETKALGRGEGGCICIPNKLYELVVRACNFGFEYGQAVRRCHCEASNWRMSDIAAAFLYARLELIDSTTISHAFLLDQIAHQEIAKSRHLKTFCPPRKGEERFISCLCILTPIHVDLEEFHDYSSIEAKRYYVPLVEATEAPEAWEWYRSIVCLPFDYTGDPKKICDSIGVLDRFVSEHTVLGL